MQTMALNYDDIRLWNMLQDRQTQ